MTLITRIARLFKADMHSLLDSIEEPQSVLKAGHSRDERGDRTGRTPTRGPHPHTEIDLLIGFGEKLDTYRAEQERSGEQ
jgi:hypothetical protein